MANPQIYVSLNHNQRRNFLQRKKSLFSKAFEVGNRFRADVCVAVRLDGYVHLFRTDSEHDWPPSYDCLVSAWSTLLVP